MAERIQTAFKATFHKRNHDADGETTLTLKVPEQFEEQMDSFRHMKGRVLSVAVVTEDG